LTTHIHLRSAVRVATAGGAESPGTPNSMTASLMNTCHIGLGANLGAAVLTLRAAAAALDKLPQTRLSALSSLYQTPAWGRPDQPDFSNAVAAIETMLEPMDLLHMLLDIECAHGRTRSTDDCERWGPRTLDLDILLYGGICLKLPGLNIPHPYLHERAFALIPLLEIAPDIHIPGIGAARDALEALPDTNIRKIRPMKLTHWQQ